VFPQHVPHNTSLYPISFALSYTLVNYLTMPKGRDYNIFILGQSKPKAFKKKNCDGPINDAHHKRGKKKGDFGHPHN
jgi:hypothetical protein